MTASEYVNNQILITANYYLNHLEEEKQKSVQKELEELREVTEVAKIDLNPSHPHFPLISEHRKYALLKRITMAVEKIDRKLICSRERPSQITFRQMQQVINLQQTLATLQPKELHEILKRIDPAITNKIYYYVWLVSGCPSQPGFSEELLKQDISVLQMRFPVLLGQCEGTLLEQIISELQEEFVLQQAHETVQDIDQFILIQNSSLSDEALDAAFKMLPENIRAEITQELSCLSNGEKVQDLRRIDQTFFTYLAQQVRYQEDLLMNKNNQRKVNIFNSREQDIYFSCRQLKALYRTMPPLVQKMLPKPPYYGRGFNAEIYKELGAHYDSKTGLTTFRLYAPRAKEIVLHLTVCGHIEHKIPLIRGEKGVWTAQTEYAAPGRTYYFMVTGEHGGEPVKKIDPFAFGNFIHSMELGQESHESVVRDVEKEFVWSDNEWMQARKKTDPAHQPMTIYEVHVPTWKKKENGELLTWRELAMDLGKYCKELGYTHVELMGAIEHPQLISMGYQVTSYFTPYSKMGTIEDFQFFVDEMHRQGIGVFLDWIPAHFAMDKFALCKLDGSALLEGDMHPTWGTYEFDYGKQFAQDFLASNVEFFLQKCHIDGLRIDAVWSMLHLDYDRPPGSRKNEKGGDINLHAKTFLRNINAYIHKKYPGVLTMAEESSNYPNVIRSIDEKGSNGKRGIGFDLAWHMGQMTDILNYMQKPAHERAHAHSLLIHTIVHVDGGPDVRPRGKVVLPLSHDENANGKRTIQRKMPGSDAERFANGRLLLTFQLLRGGGPILDFMGNEILQSDEWHGRLIQSLTHPEDPREKAKPSVQWEELDPQINPYNHHYHQGALEFRKTLNHFYLSSPGLWDQTDQGFAWIDGKDEKNSVVSFHRRSNGQQFACIFNFSDRDLQDYLISLPHFDYAPELAKLSAVKEVFNTDAVSFAGLGRTNQSIEIICNHERQPTHLRLRLPPFTAIILSEDFT